MRSQLSGAGEAECDDERHPTPRAGGGGKGRCRSEESPEKVVATGFADMHAAEVEEWLQLDTRKLTLAVQSVIQAAATFDEQKIAALGRAFAPVWLKARK